MKQKLWIDTVSALVNLYGIVPFEQVAKLLTRDGTETVSANDIEQWITDPFGGSLAKVALEKNFVYEYDNTFFVGE